MIDHSMRDEALEPIIDSFLARFRVGERPSIEDYARRHPELADALREVLPMLVAVERDLTVDRGAAFIPPSSPGTPTRLGDYRILREIGRGGMGVVYEAMQQSLGRHVALKVLPRSAAPTSALERFRLEARSAARLHHTNIVPVFGVGEEGGIHFFAMQYIRGQGLDQVVQELRMLRAAPGAGPGVEEGSVAARLAGGRFEMTAAAASDVEAPAGSDAAPACAPQTGGPNATGSPSPSRRRPGPGSGRDESDGDTGVADLSSLLSDRSRSDRVYFDGVARIAMQVADALAYSHGQGVLHRDIKPSNVLLDTRGTAWITDFGLAKADEGSGPTRPGDILGTLRYMAPERFQGVSDPRSDVYALGATLYELLVLRPAFEGGERAQLVEQIVRREPTPPRKIDPRVPLDLEVICLKCLAKERGARYATAEDLAADLGRYLAGQAIHARRTGTSERTWRWCRRNPTVAGLLAALAASLVAGLVGVTQQWRRASAQRDEARSSARRGEEAARREHAARTLEAETRLEAQRLAARTALSQGQSLADRGAVAEGMHWMAAALRQAPPGDSDFERLVRLNLASYADVLTRGTDLLPGEPPASWADLSADGSVLATIVPMAEVGGRYDARLWDVATGRRLDADVQGAHRVFFSPDGRMAAALGTSIRYVEVSTGRSPFPPPLPSMARPLGVAFSPDGRQIAEYGGTGPLDEPRGFVRLIDAATGVGIGRPMPLESRAEYAVFRPDGRAIAVVTRREELSLWSLDTEPRPILRTRLRSANGAAPVAFDPGGRWLVAWSGEGGSILRFWDAGTGRPLARRIPLGNGSTRRLAYSPDGRMLLVVETGGVIRLRDAETDRLLAFPLVRIPDGSRVACFPSGRAFLSLPDRSRGPVRRFELGEAIGAAMAPGGSDLDPSGSAAPVAPRLADARGSAAFTPDLGRVVAQGASFARIVDLENAQPVGEPIRCRWQTPGPVAIAGDGSALAVVMNNTTGPRPGSVDCRVEVRDLATGRPRGPALHPRNTVVALAFSTDARTIATGDFANLVQLWDAATGDPLGPPLLQENIVWTVAFSPDSTRLAVGTHEERLAGHAGVRIWDLATRRPIGRPARHHPTGTAEQLLWSPDGSTVTSLSSSVGELMLVDGRTGEAIARGVDLAGAPTLMEALRVEGDLLVGTAEGTVELRDRRTLSRLGRPLSPPDALLQRREVRALACAPDGRTVAAGYDDGTIRTWDIATRLPCSPPMRHERMVHALTFRDDGRTLASVSVDGEVRSWPVRPPLEGPADLIALRLEVDTAMALGPSQEVGLLSATGLASRGRDLGDREPPRPNAVPEADAVRIEGEARFAEHRARWHDALYHLDRLLAIRPDDPTVRMRRAVALAALDRRQEAGAEMARALQSDRRAACIDLLVHRALDARDAGRLALASWAIERAIALRPDDWRLFSDRADIRGRLGDASGREGDLLLAVERGADSLFLSQVADDFEAAGRIDRARDLRSLAIDRIGGREAPNLLRSLAATAVGRGDLGRADNLLARIDRTGTADDVMTCYLRAVTALALGDQAAYRARCAEALATLGTGTSPSLANEVAWICALGPSATDDPEQVVAQASRAVADSPDPERYACLNTLGAALLRAGRPSEAITRIGEGIRLRGGLVLPQDRGFLALAHHALSDHRGASRWLRDPGSATASVWDVLEVQVLFREASSAILDPPFPADPLATEAGLPRWPGPDRQWGRGRSTSR